MGRKRAVRKYKNRAAIIILPFFVFVFLLAFYTTLKNQIGPNLEDIGRMRARVIVNEIVNRAINDQLYEAENMQELLVRKTDDEGGTEILQANTQAMNIFVTELSNELQAEYEGMKEEVYYVPAGSLFGSGLMSQAGPDVRVRVLPLTVSGMDFRTEFESQGINQTKYKVYIELTSDVKVLSPFSAEHMEISTTVLVAEAVILGSVPGSYVNVPEEDILDVTQE